MNFSAPFIRRPIGTLLLSIGVFMLGVVAYFKLPVAALPSIDFPAVFISTQYPGASPKNMASTVAAPIERHVGEIAGLTELTSVSALGTSIIVALFDIDRNVDGAARDVQAALNAAAVDLPPGLPQVPIFRKANPNNVPILILALTSKTLTTSAVYDAADTVLLQRISQVDGVAEVSVAGADQPAIRVTADPAKLSAMNLSMDDIRTTIAAANALSPTGSIDGQIYGRSIETSDQLRTVEDYRNLVVRNASGTSVILSDVANVTQGTRNSRSQATFNGRPAVLIYVRKQAAANVIETVDRIKSLLPELGRFLPAGVEISILNDRTATIRASVNDMTATLIATILLVMMVVFVFLRRITLTVAAGITVPLSLAGTCACMYAAGFSIDNISLMALATSVGFVVDDAIVMIETIDKNRAAGMSPLQAALDGSRQIGFTVISISVSLMAAFIPLLLLGGVSGKLFHEFSVTLAFAILISTVASLTVTPMLCANFVSTRPPRRPNVVDRSVEGTLNLVLRLYGATLLVALRRRFIMLLVMLATIGLTAVLFVITPKGFFPDDETDLIMVTTEAPAAISYKAVVPLQNRVAELIQSDPAIENVGASLGNPGGGPNASSINQGRLFVSLKPTQERGGETTAEVVERLRKKLQEVVGIKAYLVPQQDLRMGGRDGKGVFAFTISDSNFDELTSLAPKVIERIKQIPQLADVTTDNESTGLQANVVVDRTAASRLGVTMANIDNALNDSFSQRQISIIYSPRNQYRVILSSPFSQLRQLTDIGNIYVPAGVSLQQSTSLGTGDSVQTALNSGGNTAQPLAGTGAAGTQTGANTGTQATNATRGTTNAPTAGTNFTGTTLPAFATGQIKLESISHIDVGFAPMTVNHQGQFPEVTINFNLKKGAKQEEANQAILDAFANLHLPGTLHGEFTGTAKLFQQSRGAQSLLLYAALISVYIVLGVLYESFAHPLTIISTLPSAGLGALLALQVTNTELTLIAFIGIILLIGIVKKNGIMLVDFALQAERQRGMKPTEAIYEACMERFRPILMTTLAALLGALPFILSSGPGSALRRPLGITIAGGLLVSQVLTLYTTPVVYLYLDRLHHFLRRLRLPWQRRPAPAPAE